VLALLLPDEVKPVFGNDLVEVTPEAAERMGTALWGPRETRTETTLSALRDA
jgi:hypothetical protein